MKASELMIGDWGFSAKLQKVFKVMGIENDHDEIKSVGCHIPMRILEPIPLTDEILKANGFGVCYESCYQTKYSLWLFDDEVCVEIKLSKQTEDYNYIKIFIEGCGRVNIHILHVHELQHALRLCGLNAIADNFKVTD